MMEGYHFGRRCGSNQPVGNVGELCEHGEVEHLSEEANGEEAEASNVSDKFVQVKWCVSRDQ